MKIWTRLGDSLRADIVERQSRRDAIQKRAWRTKEIFAERRNGKTLLFDRKRHDLTV